ncbi:MAG: energy-coupling factor transporter transmembrane protein EcfT [candidate division NC10 bacterium]|nr:energy-coupling factor transporter transmembrane protein EcfT [candidate division NC10 bacterium]
MNLYLYLDRDTFVHRLDPRTKILLLLASFAMALLFSHPFYVASVLGLILLYCALGGSLGNLRKIWFLLLTIGLLSLAGWSLFARGQTPLFWRVTWESFSYGLATAIKIDTMIVAGVIFLSTTKNEEVTLALIRLGIPYSAAFAFSMALRLVPTFAGTASTVVEAQRSRGLDLESGNVLERAKKYIPLLAPVFLNTIRSTDQLAMALEGKGFGSRRGRTFYLEIGFKKGDFLALAITLALLALALVMRMAGFGRIPGLSA